MSSFVSRRRLLQLVGAGAAAGAVGPLLSGSPAHAAVPPLVPDTGVLASPSSSAR